MKPRTAILSFLCVEAVLYAAFLALDLTGRGGDTIVLKYTGVLLCLAFSLLCALQGGDRLVPPALALTAAQEKRGRNGTAFTYAGRPGQYRAYGAGGEFLALVQTDGEKLTTVKSFFDV